MEKFICPDMQTTFKWINPLTKYDCLNVQYFIPPLDAWYDSIRHKRIHSSELNWSGGWSTGTVDWLSASERGQYLDGCPAMNTKCLVPLPFLPDLILWSTENRYHGSPVLVPPETQ